MALLGKVSGKKQTSSSSSNSPTNSPSNSPSQTTTLRLPTKASQPVDQDKFSFLESLTSSSKHLHKSFYEHLFNVYTHLAEQKLPKQVCDAGLFHSIYGTEFYDFHSSRITRDVVRGYIGDYAEELVHTFCSVRKRRFHAIVNNTLGLSERQQIDLCYVEFANIWDQKDRPGREKEAHEKLEILNRTITRLENSK